MDIFKWKELLQVEDCELFDIETKLDLHNQRVIASDVDRTRSSLLTLEEKNDLEKLLTYYCKEFNTSYKQGMNEILAPFLYMARDGLVLCQVYQYFKSFLHKYLPTMYADQSFKPLQAMFMLFKLLLRYFDPRLSTFFLVNHIEPQSFMTPWLLTLFAGKISNIESLFYLWEEIIHENDVIFSVFLSIAIILDNKDCIALCTDKIIPQLISQISLENIEKLKFFINNAKELKKSLPYSVLLSLYECDVFNLEAIDSLIENLEKEAVLSLGPKEVLHRAYPEIDICNCEDLSCEWRTGRGHNIPLVLIDCRLDRSRCFGILPNSVLLDAQAYSDTEFMLNFPDKFIPMRSIFHFCLMSSSFYKGQCFDLSQMAETSNDIEQNMIENLLQVFLMKGFPFISVLQGGFDKVHDLALELYIKLENHDKPTCPLCIQDRKKSDSKSKSFRTHRKPSEPPLKPKEQKESNSRKSQNDKFLFICQKLEDNDPEECMINVSDQWFGISLVSNELVQEIIRVKISGLQKLTILKKDPKMIEIKFAEHGKTLCFLMKSVDEAKVCVNQIAKYFQMALNFPV
jgi:hypothetical protein